MGAHTPNVADGIAHAQIARGTLSRMGIMNRTVARVAVLVACVALAACTPQTDAPGSIAPTALPKAAPVGQFAAQALKTAAPGSVSEAQRAELADGVVTYDEYQAAFQRMNACIEADGYELLIEPEVNQMIQARILDAAFPSYERCYPLEFGWVDSEWQIYRWNFGADTQALAACLIERGQVPALTYNDRYLQFVALGLNPDTDRPGVKNQG